jgi:hypothetical protein
LFSRGHRVVATGPPVTTVVLADGDATFSQSVPQTSANNAASDAVYATARSHARLSGDNAEDDV